MISRFRDVGRHVGLRARLLVAFTLLCLLTAAAVAGGNYVHARNVILQQAQDAAVANVTSRLETLYPLRDLAPDPASLTEIADVVNDRDSSAVAVRGEAHSEGLDLGEVPRGVREAVADGDVAWQRVVRYARAKLIIGAPLLVVAEDGTTRPSGIEVYTATNLDDEQTAIARLAGIAWLTGAGALVLAVLLAVLSARGVLRPARELAEAARRLGGGDLRTRIEVRGSDELAQVARTFNDTAAALEAQVERLRAMEADARRFVADVSHELRTPLAAMVAVSDLLEEEAERLPAHAGDAAALVGQETRNLDRLVNDLIDISRFDSQVAALALDELEVTGLVRTTLRSRGWWDRVRVELPPEEVVARLDPRRVDVVLANLVGNALRHGRPPVTVSLRADERWLTFAVRDSGDGLGPEVRAHVFDRFYKADTARTRSEGSGLGLAIAQENARLHRDGERTGGIAADDAPEGGAVFTLALPRWAADSGDGGGRP